jgi:hypothetical protein
MAFDERKLVDPDFNTVHMDCNQSGMSRHWGIIQGCCNKWHGIQIEITNHVASGTSIADQASRISCISSPICIDTFVNIMHISL